MIVSVLTGEQIEAIHQTSLSILEKIGVIVPHDEVLARFADTGATVDGSAKRVKIPPELVMNSIQQAGKTFTLHGRDMSRKAEFGVGARNYNSTAGEALWVDNVGEERRYACLSDVAAGTRLSDALEQITMPGAMADPHELPVAWRCVAVAAEMLRNTTKPIHFWFHDRASAQYLVELITVIRGDREKARQYPLCYPLLEPISPLKFPYNGVDLLFETSRLNMPVPIGPMAQMGLSAPATLAGTMAQQNAEILAGICITQLIRAGMPICYGGICHAFDMKTTQLIFSGPEQAIFGVAMTQMGKYYGLPVYINVGLTDSKRPDAQAGLECGITLAMGVSAGADIFGHMGICGVDQASSLDILVMQAEIIAYAERLHRTFEVTDDTLALDVIEDVVPNGNFIDHIHTAQHFRKELWFPKMLDRNFYDIWQERGAASMEEQCRIRKDDLLAHHEVEPLPNATGRELDKIVASAQKNLQQ